MEDMTFQSRLMGQVDVAIKAHTDALAGIAPIRNSIIAAAEIMIASAKAGGTLLVCGNGGSAADSQHIAAEYVGRFQLEREPMSAIALSTNTSALTAIANDYGFEQVFARQVRAYARPGDVVLGLSTSGSSPNVLRALEVARQRGAKTVGLVGPHNSAIGRMADVAIYAPGAATPQVQEMHILIGHILCGLVEEHACVRL